MKNLWIRGKEKVVFTKPQTFFVLGVKGSGKSSLLEHFAEQHLENGGGVLDLYGSRDGEGLAFLRSPWVETKKVLLVCGDNVDVDCSFPVKHVSKLRLQDLEDNDLVISSSPCYSSPNSEYMQVNKLVDLLYQRLSWKKITYVVIREASSLYYSRLRVSENQLMAKSESVYLIRESRHMGVSMGLDTLKQTSIDLDVRSVVDYSIIKAVGLPGLPRELEWLYSFVDPHYFRQLKKDQFIILSKEGSIGLGVFPEVKWHKDAGEHILKALGLKIEYGEEIRESRKSGSNQTVGDVEHGDLVSMYEVEKQSMGKIAAKLKRSKSTVKAQIDFHNGAVSRSGFCPICKRVKSDLQHDTIVTFTYGRSTKDKPPLAEVLE